MGSSGGEHIKIVGDNAADCSETTVEIKIKTLDSQTFTLRVDKCVPVPELKEHIASVTGVLSEQQRLICRGKVLMDDQLLSAYHVEDGHTLHMVVRQPVALSPEQSDNPADPMASAGQVQGSRASPGMVVGTFNISEQGDGAFPDLNRIISAVLSSFGAARSGSGGEGIDLNQPPLERLFATPGLSGSRNSSGSSDQPASVPVEPLQPPVIPDSMTTLQQYLSHLRQEFSAYAGGQSANARNTGFSVSDGEAAASEPRRLLTPESLAEVMSSARLLLVEQVTECLSQLAGQLESHSSVTDTSERSRIQSNALRSGGLFQNLGAMLLELGRATMTLRMGQTPADALVNAGPSVFISSTGPNPIMVQPLPFQPGSSFGSVPVGTVQHGSGLGGGSVGSGFLPRNIDIRIRTGSLFSRREPPGSQPQGQTGTPPSNSANSAQQDAAVPVDSNSRSREPQLRAVPLRTVVTAVPASMARSSDSSRGSIGILYPILARVQHLSSGNSNGSRASHASDQHHAPSASVELPIPVPTTHSQNVATPAGNGSRSSPSEAPHDHGMASQIREGLQQLLSSMFPGAQVVNDDGEVPRSGSVPSRTESAQDISSSQQSASAVSDEGVRLSNILRQIMPILSENAGAEPETPSTEGADADEPQVDDNTDQGSSRRRRGSQSQPSSKRRRRE
ncbi:hypothetical protein ACS0TY_022410 [Phlomoides rotata]